MHTHLHVFQALDKMYQFDLHEMQDEAYQTLKSESKAAREKVNLFDSTSVRFLNVASKNDGTSSVDVFQELEYRRNVLRSPKKKHFAPPSKYQRSTCSGCLLLM